MAQLEGGIGRVTFPMPMGPMHVHGYLLPVDDGYLLVDTGLGLRELAEGWAELLPQLDRPIAGIVITHFHPDHVGGGHAAVDATGVPVYQGQLDYEQCERVWGSPDWGARIGAWFETHGSPAEATEQLIAAGSVYRTYTDYARNPQRLREGDEIEGWRVGEFPGHADGHICLSKDGILIAGDHLLPRITPAVGLYPESRPDPLGDYMRSLERVAELAPRVALPGHGDPLTDPAGRALEIVQHHRDRLDAAEAVLDRAGRTGYQVSYDLFPDDRGPGQRRFAVAETLSHLERLVVEGRAARGSVDGRVAYTRA